MSKQKKEEPLDPRIREAARDAVSKPRKLIGIALVGDDWYAFGIDAAIVQAAASRADSYRYGCEAGLTEDGEPFVKVSYSYYWDGIARELDRIGYQACIQEVPVDQFKLELDTGEDSQAKAAQALPQTRQVEAVAS